MSLQRTIIGWVDSISREVVKGWACIDGHAADKLDIVVSVRGQPIASGSASSRRGDLVRASIGDGHCAFAVALPHVDDVRDLCVMAFDRESGSELLLPIRPDAFTEEHRVGYQSFDGLRGDSDSAGKLAALRMPDVLDGSRVLDIGCNEGFFCIESLKRGAARVVGIDASEAYVARARERSAEVDYRCGSWWQLPDESFDLILFLSAIHYERQQKELLELILSRLAKGGKLILECGVAPGAGKAWHSIYRHDGFMRFPTRELLIDELLSGFDVTEIGKSVAQSGDPVPRFVFHCSRKLPTCLVIAGQPGEDAMGTVRLFRKAGAVWYDADEFFLAIKATEARYVAEDPFLADLRDNFDPQHPSAYIDTLQEKGFVERLVAGLIENTPLDTDLTVVAGQAFANGTVLREFGRVLEKRGCRVWVAGKLEPSGLSGDCLSMINVSGSKGTSLV